MMPADLRLQCFLEPVRTAVTDRATHCPKCNPDSATAQGVPNWTRLRTNGRTANRF